MIEQMPVDAFVVAPLRRLRDLRSHEQELFAGMCPHVSVEGAQVGELLPAIPGHLMEQRPLSVDDLVV
jgi:hypothetical protein